MVVGTVAVLVMLFLLTTAIVAPFISAYGDEAPETLTASSVANLVWNVCMIGAVVYLVRRSGGTTADLGLKAPEGHEKPLSSTVGYIFGFAALAFITLYVVVFIYGVVIDGLGLDFLEPDQQVPDEFYDSDVALGVLGIAIVVGAPIAEEVFFRGFLFGGARGLVSVPVAAVLTGFIFSLAHYNVGLIIPFTGVGTALALSYDRTRTLYVPIGAHFLFNLVSYSILVFVPEARPH
jgi:membrane protease YdiL (CAAX protease family)